jgi:hypothetical protein
VDDCALHRVVLCPSQADLGWHLDVHLAELVVITYRDPLQRHSSSFTVRAMLVVFPRS